jgi:hypothetical protein
MNHHQACVILGLFLSYSAISLADNTPDPLSSREADQIIAARYAKQKERDDNLKAELEKAEVLSEGVGTLPYGRKVIVREVAPPVEKKEASTVSVELPDQLVLTAEHQAWIDQQKQLQKHEVLMFSCTVYDRQITEVRWTYESAQYLAHTNADFNYLRAVHSVQTETDQFDYFMGIGDSSSENASELLPDLSVFDTSYSGYVLSKGNPSSVDALAGLEALLEHYDANLDLLKVEHQRREALSAANKRYKEQNPEEPEDFVLQFWVPNQAKEGTNEQ